MNDKNIQISLRQRLIKGGSWALFGKVTTALIGLIINSMLARLLVPSDLGRYFLLFSFVSLISLIMQLGLNQAIVKVIAESIGKDNSCRASKAVILTIRYFYISSFLGCLVISIYGSKLFELINISVSQNTIILCAFWAVLLGFQSIFSEIFRGYHDIRLSVLFGGLITSIVTSSVLIFVYLSNYHVELNDVMLFVAISSLINSIFAYLLISKMDKTKIRNELVDNVTYKDLFEIACPLWIVALTLFFLSQADIWVISIYLSQENIALYGAAFRLVILLVFPLLIVNAVLPPIIAELYSKGQKLQLERVLRYSATLIGIPSLIILSIYIIFGEYILDLVYGEFYRKGYFILVILCIGQAVNVFTGSCGIVLMMTGNQKIMMIITIIYSLIAIIAMLLSVETYGLAAIAISSTISFSLQNITMLLIVKLKTGMWTHPDIYSFHINKIANL